jgi:CO/xanthine dehydrogenase Mo-binding subunit
MALKKKRGKTKGGTYSQEEAKDIILTWLSGGWSVYRAASEAGISRQTAYEWREKDPDFAAKWAQAMESGVDQLEDVARSRAVEKSDRLMEILLKAKRPKEYRERLDVTHAGEASIVIDLVAVERDPETGELRVKGDDD